MECSAAFASPMMQPQNATIKDTLDLTYRWHIADFTTLTKGTFSPIFVGEVENKFRTKWQLQLYPHGSSQETKGYVMLFLNLVNNKVAEVEVYNYTLAIIDNLHEKSNVFQGEYPTKEKNIAHGTAKFIERSKLVSPDSPYLKNSNLEIICEIFSKANKPETSIPESHSFSKFWKYVENRKYTDATIQVGGKTFSVHKMVLAARSSVFAAMFDHDLIEANKNCVEISDFKYDTVEDLLKFIYKGEFNRTGNLMELMACADKYNVEALKTKCALALGEKLSVENAAEVLFRADLHGATSLKNKAIDYIQYNFREIYTTEIWQSLSTELTSEVIFSMADTINEMRAAQNHNR